MADKPLGVCRAGHVVLVREGGHILTSMCRSIKTLRAPYLEEVTDDDVAAAALQYVRKIAGMRKPSKANEPAFAEAVDEVAAATRRLLDGISQVGRAR